MSNIINVYGYDVHYIKKSDETIMYFAADIVKQYNTKNGKKKHFYHCLENKDTKELIQVIAENQEKMSDVGVLGKYGHPYNADKMSKNLYVPNVIEYVKISDNKYGMVGYVVCLDLLHHVLCWCDINFGYTVYHFLSEEFEKKNSPITQKLYNDYMKLVEENNDLKEEISSQKIQYKELINKVEKETDTSYCDYNIDRYIVYIRQKDKTTLEVKKLSKNFNKRAYKQFLYDYFADKHSKEEIDERIANGEELEFDDSDLRIVYAKNNGVGESFKRYIINMLKAKIGNHSYIDKITLNKIIYNRPIVIEDIINLRKICKEIRTDVFTYHPESK